MAATRRIADAVATSRARASLSGPRLGLHQPDTDHEIADKVFIEDVTVPRTVDPGESIQAVVTVSTNASPPAFQIGPTAPPDKCTHGPLNTTPGWLHETSITLDDDTDATTECESSGRARDPTIMEFDLFLTAPEESGEYDYEVAVRGPDSGDLMAIEFIPMTVRDLSDDDDDDDNGDDDDSGGGGGSAPGILEQLLEFLNTAIDRAITTISDLVLGIRDLILGFAETVEEALYALAEWLADNPLLLAAVATVAFYVAPRVADFVFGNFTPIGWLDRAAGSVLG